MQNDFNKFQQFYLFRARSFFAETLLKENENFLLLNTTQEKALNELLGEIKKTT